MSIEGDDTHHISLYDLSGKLLPIQDSFASDHLLALRFQEQEKGKGYRIPWDDTGESILPLLEWSEREFMVRVYQVRVEL
ncbi:MAG: hypothetical protein ACFFER_04830 [Candidatus Thorarchaeota archaeon]